MAKALLDAPDFLRLGLMLALEHRPVEPRAREMFLQVRDNAFHRFAQIVRDVAPELDEERASLLTTYAIAGADGLFIAKEVGGDSVDLIRLFDLHTRLVFEAASDCSHRRKSPHECHFDHLAEAAQLLHDAQRRGVPLAPQTYPNLVWTGAVCRRCPASSRPRSGRTPPRRSWWPRRPGVGRLTGSAPSQ